MVKHGVKSVVANIGTTFLGATGSGGEPGSGNAVQARSSGLAGDSAPVSGRKVDRCSEENISSLYLNFVWCVNRLLARRLVATTKFLKRLLRSVKRERRDSGKLHASDREMT
jgi:hypothetical protein